MERGPEAKVFPSGDEPRVDRHGLWRGLDADGHRVWEVRYTRGVPTGPYRQWDSQGELIATWPYTWDGEVEGWARWFEGGEPAFKFKFGEETARPDFDPIGNAERFRVWAESQETPDS